MIFIFWKLRSLTLASSLLPDTWASWKTCPESLGDWNFASFYPSVTTLAPTPLQPQQKNPKPVSFSCPLNFWANMKTTLFSLESLIIRLFVFSWDVYMYHEFWLWAKFWVRASPSCPCNVATTTGIGSRMSRGGPPPLVVFLLLLWVVNWLCCLVLQLLFYPASVRLNQLDLEVAITGV